MMLGSRQAAFRLGQQIVLRSAPSRKAGSFWEANNFDHFKVFADKQAHAAQTADFWKKLTFFAAFPVILLTAINAYIKEQHEHHKPRPPFIPYDHLTIRHKPFPWGDGNHTLFHNPRINALPEGYEIPDPNAEGGHH